MNDILIVHKDFNQGDFEFIERKGLGHPDTLADMLAEYLSNKYSNYTLKKFGAILHHNFDKMGLLGGTSFVIFGQGYLTKPIKVLINGRVSTKFGRQIIPIRKLLVEWIKEFFKNRLPNLNINKDLDFCFNISNQSSPGKTHEKESLKGTRRYWFEPRGLDDLPELKKLVANDTSLGVGYAPSSMLEKVVLDIESVLNSSSYKRKNPWMGSDIKILAFRSGSDIKITMCIPQIANNVKNIGNYKENLTIAASDIKKIVRKYSFNKFELNINTRDKFDVCEIYLTATGSSIESGDEGLAGRGNRVNQLITPNRPMNIECVFGKNPVYHIGKIYYVSAFKIAEKIYKKFGIENEVYLASQSGKDLLDPWITVVTIPKGFEKLKEIQDFVYKEFSNLSKITSRIINGKEILP